ncbi:AEC family transporter [Cetobacterium sp. 8H]|uniref:AEC family transporter n=1 Tax=Cetobacterium sp. 8H TaxID=2759681 RepID=UPI00163CD460|nr:AEC family transporter [Cetobacterium sp. 8H]MBC2850236.1 AEC family transporter [Cetobacterium sp. 8H]
MNIANILHSLISDKNIIGVMSSSIFIMVLGFYMGKTGKLKSSLSIPLGEIILSISIPALSFNAFMKDFNKDTFINGINILIWSFFIHVFLIFIGDLFYKNFDKNKQLTLKMMTTFGGVTVFGIPIAQAIYGDLGIIYSSIFSIPYRILLYSYGFIKMSGVQIDKKNIKTMFFNPVIIATFLGLFIWVFQQYLPQVSINGQNYALFRFDKTAFWIYKPLAFLAGLCSPLAWLAAGLKLSEISIQDSLKSKVAWQFSIIKTVFLPTFLLVIIMISNHLNLFKLSATGIGVIIIMMATPTASVIIAYSLKYNREPLITSSCSFLSTIFSLITIPILVMILNII